MFYCFLFCFAGFKKQGRCGPWRQRQGSRLDVGTSHWAPVKTADIIRSARPLEGSRPGMAGAHCVSDSLQLVRRVDCGKPGGCRSRRRGAVAMVQVTVDNQSIKTDAHVPHSCPAPPQPSITANVLGQVSDSISLVNLETCILQIILHEAS